MKHFIAVLTVICLFLSVCPIGLADGADVSTADEVFWYRVTDDGTALLCGIKPEKNCPSELTIPRKLGGYPVTRIDSNAFYNRKELTSVTIPFGVTSIGDYAFLGCDGLTSIIIPNSVTGIGKEAFAFCSRLTKLTLPDSVTKYEGSFYGIGSDSFFHCPIKELVIANGSSSVTSDIVVCKDSLEKVIIPDSVTRIGKETFSGCTALTSIEIPNSVTSIGSGAFSGCTGLTSITIPNSVTSIENYVFSRCTGLTSVVIPDSVTSIGIWAFYSCKGLTSITIPNSVTSIGSGAFDWCTGLTSITISDSVKNYDDLFYNCPIKELIIAKGSKTVNSAIVVCKNSLEKVIIPDSVTSIGTGAFSDCAGLTNITIPDDIRRIGRDAFVNTGIYLDTSNWENGALYISGYLIDVDTTLSGEFFVKSGTKGIAEGAFEGCRKLTNITIPSSVTYIDDSCGISFNYEDDCRLPLVITTAQGSRAEEYAKSRNIKVQYLDHPTAAVLVQCRSDSVTLKYIDGYEYKMDDGEWQSNNVFTGLAPNSTHKFYQRIAETDTAYASDPSEALAVTTLKNTVERPPLPEVLSKTSNSVTLKSTIGYEYSISGTVWQKSNVFIGLKGNTRYTFFQRVAETDTSYASDFSYGLIVWTDSIYIPGDLNCDGIIDICDLIKLKKLVAKGEIISENDPADVDKDGVLDEKDIIALKKLLIGA